MKVTKHPSGKESYEFTIRRDNIVRFLSSVIENNSSYEWWLPVKSGEWIKIIVEDIK
jgi:hypothetical protein